MKVSYFKYLLILVFILSIWSCVETITTTQSTSMSLTISSPVTGDTIKTGRTNIQYVGKDKTDGPGISHYEIIVNDDYDGSQIFFQDGVDTTVVLYLEVDTTFIGKKIKYQVNMYNLDGDILSKDFTGIYVKRNTDPPDQPTNLSLIKTSDTSVLLVWTDNASNETNYQLYRKDGVNGVYRSTKLLPSNSSSTNDLDLSPFIVYYYKVIAYNQYGYSKFSNEVSSTGASSGDVPTNLQAEALGATAVRLTWVNHSTTQLGVKIQRKDGGESVFNDLAIVAGTINEYIDEYSLIASTSYQYRVASFNSTSQSSWSNIATVMTYSTDINPPSGLVATFSASQRGVEIKWRDNTTYETGTVIERSVGNTNAFTELLQVDQDVTTYFDEDIEEERIYYYRAKHLTTEGFYTKYSNTDSATVPKLALAAPYNLTITQFNSTQFGLTWVLGAASQTAVELQRKAESTSFSRYKLLTGNAIAYNDIIPDSTIIFTYRVRSINGSDTSAFSNEVNTAGGSGNILRPTNLTGNVISGQLQIQLFWQDNSGNELGFKIERKLNSTFQYSEVGTVAPNSTSFLDATDGLFRGSSYDYRIRAYNSEGYSEYSNVLTIEIPF